ncbi:MAG: 50S ribosome-binding GTPase [Kiritimatiellae bacterium]|nr:50S ribosome-binding GTPase [Kiritimatiellia bacterium]
MAKVATVAVVGRTNAGKSTLVNALVGEKVSIVSPVEQTTRNTIRGIVADPRGQLVLLDTPGLHKAVGTLGTLLNRMARRSAAGTDITCVVFDASQEPQLEDIGWMQRVAKEKPEKVVFVLNKADKSPFFEKMFRDAWQEACGTSGSSELELEKGVRSQYAGVRGQSGSSELELEKGVRGQESGVRSQSGSSELELEKGTIPLWVKSISTTEGGAKGVLDALFDFAEEGEKLFDDDIVTDYPRKLAIADVIREKYLAHLHQELPHELGIIVKRVTDEGSRWKSEAEVLVNRPSQKPIVIGRSASTIKAVRKAAERELKEVFGVPVSLELWVNVEPNWMKNQKLLSEMGYLGGLV